MYHRLVNARSHNMKTAFLLAKCGFASAAMFKAGLAPLGLRPPLCAVMWFLDKHDGVSQRDLGEGLHVDPSTIVGLVDELEAGGYAVRERDEEDRRRYSVRLTDDGRRMLEQVREVADRNDSLLLGSLSSSERAQLHALLLKVCDSEQMPAVPHPGMVLDL
jgi:DNA-binding MarR family transcriptional regulator